MSLCRLLVRAVLCLLSGLSSATDTADDGDWRLTIDGHHRFVFGDQVLQGYVQIPWRVDLEFSIVDGRFAGGSGAARWVDRVSSGSRPVDWFACRLLTGSYLDANLKLREMPRVRFARFPLAGALRDGTVELKPGYSLPGNYLAVRYGCETQREGAGNWFVFATRARNEEGKRQDAKTREQGNAREARVNEVKALPPLEGLSLPLRDGWFFHQGHEEADYFARFQLRRD